ncbi:MAG: CSLREA domain-containing protein, partial [Xanthomonadales bacterium]|nr:CSLREA domain-containing protein [Xanthomonadales bacterium]
MRRHYCKGIVVAAALFASEFALAASITVNTATDDFGGVTSNCSLREAIQTANTNADFGGCTHTGIFNAAVTDVINLPTLGAGGFFTLNRIGTDDTNSSGDLDITGLLRIE